MLSIASRLLDFSPVLACFNPLAANPSYNRMGISLSSHLKRKSMVQTKLEIKTTGLDHVVLWVSDLEWSKRFYIDVLGMTVNHESDWQSFLWCGYGH